MALPIRFSFFASMALTLSLTCICLARTPQQPPQYETAIVTGIVTDHLSHARLRVWKSIVDLVTAKDKMGRDLYPILNGLYRAADTSGHLIRIELSEEESLSHAGEFRIRSLDPSGTRHVTEIRLNLATIRRTYVGEGVRYSNGLMPFAGLTTKQRYAEVLGHELAHAIAVFQSAESLRLYQELERNKELGPADAMDPNGHRAEQLARVEELMRQIEKPAEAAELEIWRELQGRTSTDVQISKSGPHKKKMAAVTPFP